MAVASPASVTNINSIIIIATTSRRSEVALLCAISLSSCTDTQFDYPYNWAIGDLSHSQGLSQPALPRHGVDTLEPHERRPQCLY